MKAVEGKKSVLISDVTDVCFACDLTYCILFTLCRPRLPAGRSRLHLSASYAIRNYRFAPNGRGVDTITFMKFTDSTTTGR